MSNINEAIAEITSASHDNAEHGERGIRILRDFQHLEYGTKLYAHPAKCLHQIQEPEADIWPCVNIDVDASGKITNAKLYSPGLPAGNHDVYPVRVPYMDEHTEAWRACVDELEKAVPGFMSLGNMNGIECAVAAIRGLSERAKHQELAAAEQAAWHAGLDEGRAQAAPAAVAVPDERAALTDDERAFVETVKQRPGEKLNSGEAWGADGNALWEKPESLGLIRCVGSYKWVAAPVVVPAGWKLVPLKATDEMMEVFDATGSYEKMLSVSPQPQWAPTRDVVSRNVERRIVMTPLETENPAEVRITWKHGDKKPEITITDWNVNGNGTALPGNPDAAIHGACNLLLDALDRKKTTQRAAIAAAKGEQQ